MKFILATTSPRRKQLFHFISDGFDCVDAGFDESIVTSSDPAEVCYGFAKGKALSVAEVYPSDCVLGFDTVVSVDGMILGKPHDPDEAYSMLRSLSGRKHIVLTAVYIVSADYRGGFVSQTEVFFRELSEEMIRNYIATDEPYDKAGGYSIQGGASVFCEKIIGDYYTVMGLPVSSVYFKLKELGYL